MSGRPDWLLRAGDSGELTFPDSARRGGFETQPGETQRGDIQREHEWVAQRTLEVMSHREAEKEVSGRREGDSLSDRHEKDGT